MKDNKHFKSLFNRGGWQKVIGCEDCNSYYAEKDINIYAPCKNCGGLLTGFKSETALWEDRKWKTRTKQCQK